ncbi:2-succinylbenzoate--CoA ligase [Serratia fonticola]|uniref:2-succinylbenzoate--CoA ligase n=1 Tax=Serratia fonticola TaxID=47917 RepID=A0A3S4Z135_SERFO|nr:2-succinylbenzoate--CoA ligase [Serratia fonticola]
MEQGELRIIGRLDNLFFSGGEGVQPEDVERVFAAHPQVLQVFIVPIDDEEFGQRPVAVVDLEGELTLEGLMLWAQDRLANFQRPIAALALPDELKTAASRFRAVVYNSGRVANCKHNLLRCEKGRPRAALLLV